MNYKISVIIPFFYSKRKNKENEFALLSFEKCLRAISKSKYKNYEVILVSDNSSDDSIKLANKYPFKIKKLKKNYGAAYARNQGAKLCKGEILLFIDSDVEINVNAMNIINQHYNTKNNYGILQGVYSHKPNYESSATQYLMSYHCYYLFSETKNNKFTKSLCSCFVAIKKDIFIKNGGFDINFNNADPEDIDLGYRLINKGLKIPLEKKLKSNHHINISTWSFVKRTLRMHTNEMKMYLRNRNISMKIKQSNYTTIILSMILIFIKIILSSLYFFYEFPHFEKIFITLVVLFLLLHANFLKFVLISKGFIVTLNTVFYIFLHRILFIICFFKGIFDFYILRNKY